MTGVPVGLMMCTASSLKSTEYLASQMGPIPTRFSWKLPMTCPPVGKSEGSDRSKSQVAVDTVGGPVAAPTVICGDVVSTFFLGALGVRKILLAPESTKAVVDLSCRRSRRVANFLLSFAYLSGGNAVGVALSCLSGGISGGGGLQLDGDTSEISSFKVTFLQLLSTFLSPSCDPTRHNTLFQPSKRFPLFFSNSKQSSGA